MSSHSSAAPIAVADPAQIVVATMSSQRGVSFHGGASKFIEVMTPFAGSYEPNYRASFTDPVDVEGMEARQPMLAVWARELSDALLINYNTFYDGAVQMLSGGLMLRLAIGKR